MFKEHFIFFVVLVKSITNGFITKQVRRAYSRYVNRVSCHSSTLRFDTERYERPFNSIYLPCSFLNDNEDAKLVQIAINWS